MSSFKLILTKEHVKAMASSRSTSRATTPKAKAKARQRPKPSKGAFAKKAVTQDVSRTYETTIQGDGGTTMGAIDVPFDPKAVFGAVRAPVVVTIGGYRYRSTIFRMHGQTWVPLRASNQQAAGVKLGDSVRVTLTLDTKPRRVTPSRELAAALKAAGVTATFKAMSYTHQREWVEAVNEAKKAETREKRIADCVKAVRKRG